MAPKKDWNSAVNQTIKRAFLHNEVYTNITDMASFLFDLDCEGQTKYATCDDFSNFWRFICPHCSEFLPDWYENIICPNCHQPVPEPPDAEGAEIMEYYMVSPKLGALLGMHGECVLSRAGAWIWGRQAFGQDIMLDHVISLICNDMGLLKESDSKET